MTIVGFAGMTHLGIISASAIAQKGFKTICYDGNSDLIGQLKVGKFPIVEPGLEDQVIANGDKQIFSDNLRDLGQCDLVYIAPDIPTDDLGRSDVGVIHQLIDQVGPVLKADAVMVVLSQVEPGFTRALTQPADLSRRYYQVETLVFGRAVERATMPERYIVGCANPDQPLDPHFHAVLSAFDCPILPMRYESAELAKISINFCLVSSISVANTLAEICESIGADWSEIVPALKLDRRIGQYSYLSPGLGIAGGNLERDLTTIERIGGVNNTDTTVVAAWKTNSRYRRDWAARTIHQQLLDLNPQATVAIWGLAYKENTHSTKNSPSLATISQMPKARLRLHDPVVGGEVVEHANFTSCQSPLEAARGADALMIMTPWDDYRNIAPSDIAEHLDGHIVLDPYRVLDISSTEISGLEYHTLGRAFTSAQTG